MISDPRANGHCPRLSGEHRRTLEKGSAIKPEVIAAREYATVATADELASTIDPTYHGSKITGHAEPGMKDLARDLIRIRRGVRVTAVCHDPDDDTDDVKKLAVYVRWGVDGDARKAAFRHYQIRPALLIPIWWNGKIAAHRLRPDTPRTNGDSRVIKYEQPSGLPNHLDANPLAWDAIQDPTRDIVITEGEKKGDALWSVGVPTIALTGVWNWLTRVPSIGDDKGESRPLDQWADVPLSGRTVWIVFDSDAATKEGPRGSRTELTYFLRGRGADVRWLVLPPTGHGKTGVDDLLAAGWTWERLVAECGRTPSVGDLVGGDKETRRLLADADRREYVRQVRSGFMNVSGTGRLTGAGDFALNEPETIPALWGDGDRILWAVGEGCMICGHQGTGKSTVVQQIVLHRAGLLGGDLLGLTVQRDDRPTLYLAMDRPRQIARSLRRMVREDQRELFNERVKIWKGPLPVNILGDKSALADWAESVCPGVGLVIADSVKDFAPGIAKDDTGAALNIAWQEVIARNIDLGLVHHERKADGKNGRTHTLDDVYGSTWLTSGLGSVIVLDGNPGEALQELRHLKQPAAVVGPLTVRHDHVKGRTALVKGTATALDVLRKRGAIDEETALPAHDIALDVYGRAGRNEIARTKRDLADLVDRELAHEMKGAKGGAGGGTPARWYLSGFGTFTGESET